ncbi:hypothetical protein VNO78_21640 [Psophocarpus tetragonolobus]|uniref:Non-haem dioxygenase N-terminal domain-containing protein n=1 Tax=Psophocarpus tetragonolobus TaxID=3891 RepID=A0AAN9XIJ4_PSOTE
MERDASSSSFSKLDSAQEKSLSCVPQQYVIPLLHRPDLLEAKEYANVAVIDVAALKKDSATRFHTIQEIRNVCRRLGFFQVVNHGVSESVLAETLFEASNFFDLPTKEKLKLMSNDVHKPVRYGTSLKDGIHKVQFWRVFSNTMLTP